MRRQTCVEWRGPLTTGSSAERELRKFVPTRRERMTANNGGAPQKRGLTAVTAVDLHPQAHGAHAREGEPERIVCPVCGGHNPPEAVFCGNPTCHKALGEFKYALEELRAEARWHHVVADKVTAFIGKPQFVAAHFVWFAFWIALNTGFFAAVRIFDEYPFFGLVTILAVETIFITIFVLISNGRQTAHADKRAELDYEVNVLTYREMHQLNAAMRDVIGRLERLEAAVHEYRRGER
jgi:uncharacterized membrane protein